MLRFTRVTVTTGSCSRTAGFAQPKTRRVQKGDRMARRFSAQMKTITRDLLIIIRKMEATSLDINQNILSGEATIVFDRAGQRYVFRCSQYEHPMDNLRAAQLTMTYLWRGLEEYGVTSDISEVERMFDTFFLGFTAAPDDAVLLLPAGESCWEVLSVEPMAEKQAIVNAYRALAKAHHPDYGGQAADFVRLRAAYEDALAAVEE